MASGASPLPPMLAVLSVVLAVAAYGAFYLGAPGRQSRAVGRPRVMLASGAVLTVAALAASIAATGSAVGPALVLTVMMAVASALAMAGPFLLPSAETVPRKRPLATGASSSTRSPALPPGRTPKRPPTPDA